MILPSKHLSVDRSLYFVGGEILASLSEERTVSALWADLRKRLSLSSGSYRPDISFDWFVLALDFLYMAGAIDFRGGMIERISP